MIDHMRTRGTALPKEERTFLVEAAKGAVGLFGNSVRFVNIGVEYGASVWCLLAGAPTATLYAIDPRFSLLIGDPNIIRLEGKSQSQKILTQICMPIHLCFIDGSHWLRSVRADVRNFSKLVSSEGILIFHDYHNPTDLPARREVKQAVDEWFKQERESWKEVSAPGSLCAFRKRQHLPVRQIE